MNQTLLALVVGLAAGVGGALTVHYVSDSGSGGAIHLNTSTGHCCKR